LQTSERKRLEDFLLRNKKRLLNDNISPLRNETMKNLTQRSFGLDPNTRLITHSSHAKSKSSGKSQTSRQSRSVSLHSKSAQPLMKSSSKIGLGK